MNTPRIRSNMVDGKIKSAYAKLAQAHYDRAIEIAKSQGFDTSSAISNSALRMTAVESCLEKAGAVATQWGFRP